MSSIFEKFDAQTDLTELQNDIKDAEAGKGGDFEALPDGNYEVALNQLELKESKNGKPMVAIRFKVLEGEYKGRLIFVNQVVNSGFGIHKCNELLKAMCTYVNDITVEFKSYTQYNNLLLDVFQKLEQDYSFNLEQSTNEKNKDYKNYKIVEVFSEEPPF